MSAQRPPVGARVCIRTDDGHRVWGEVAEWSADGLRVRLDATDGAALNRWYPARWLRVPGDPTAETIYQALQAYEQAAEGLGPQGNSGG